MMSSAHEITQIVLRDIKDTLEIKAVEDLQIEAWGDDERDIVPLNQFVAARCVGGSLVGAFDKKRLVGFVYGFYGHLGGRIVHHSHMLAVDPAYRNYNLGFQLKSAQRERVLADRLTNLMTWTFDPLQSLNAYFNFAKLGVTADTYKINVYGDQGTSFLHRNGTDRLFVTWLLDSQRVEKLIAAKASKSKDRNNFGQKVLRLVCNSDSGIPARDARLEDATTNDFLSIEIPANINAIEKADFDFARRWREETRNIFTEALSKGFVVVDYRLHNERSGAYLLEHSSHSGLEN